MLLRNELGESLESQSSPTEVKASPHHPAHGRHSGMVIIWGRRYDPSQAKHVAMPEKELDVDGGRVRALGTTSLEQATDCDRHRAQNPIDNFDVGRVTGGKA